MMTTTFKRELSTESSQASQSGCFDPFESFINYDQTVASTPSISPLSTKASVTPTSSTSNTLVPLQPSPQTFRPPSHQYDDYKQQTSFPVGALANTYGVNHMDMSYSNSPRYYGTGMTMPSGDGYFGMNTTDDMLDFGTAPIQNASGTMDLDFGSPSNINAPNTDFINPAAIIEEETSARTLPSQIHPGRVYPGMHQQAALAKAQADAQQQQAMAQQQRKTPSHSRQTSRSGTNARPTTDPHVEESISRLLNQMRQSSVASSNDDDAATPTASGSQSHSARMRKDEEDMDEDERLLASEEGKKLSSKERRQLRNKVSARAFRSRRKEYIGQLEGEIAAKSQEADELRKKNEDLTAENTRLADLTRMLLSSSAFQTFLADLSGTRGPVNVPELPQSQPQNSSIPSQSATPRKDVNPNQAISRHQLSQSQNNLRVGMTMIPEEPSFEYTAIESTNTGYTENMDFGLYDAQVYAVTAVPHGPAVDTMDFAMLHGKSSNFAGPLPSLEDDTKDAPAAIEFVPVSVGKMEMPEPIETPSESTDIDASDPAFALFVDQAASLPATSSSVVPEDCIFGEIELEKAFGRVELILEGGTSGSGEVCSATWERFERLCSRLDAASARVCAITAHL